MVDGQLGWEIAYRTGSSDQSLNDLVNAVKDGADVKVHYTDITPQRGIQWARELPSVAVAEDEDQGTPTVAGALLGLIDTQLDFVTGRDVERPLAEEWQAYNTTGRRTTVTSQLRRRCLLGFQCSTCWEERAERDSRATSWLVRRGWERIYEHNAGGTPVFGSLDTLLLFAGDGADVKVRVSSSQSSQNIVWFHRLHSVTVAQSPDSGTTPVISGMITTIPSTTLAITSTEHSTIGQLDFAEPFSFEWHIYNTTGKRRVVKLRNQEYSRWPLTGRISRCQRQPVVLSDELDNIRVGWYIRRNPPVG